MSQILVWDLPTRIFHWLLAIGFLTAFGIAMLASDEHPIFPFHSILGLVLGLMVMLRILWGFVGTRHALFRSFLFSPASLFGYLKDVFTRKGNRYLGHNPGSGYAIFAMLILVLATVLTGLLKQTAGEAVEELHEVLAYCTMAVVAAHVAGVAWHTIRHRENITFSMIHGTKEGVPGDAIPSARPVTGIVFFLLIAFWAGGLVRNYDRNAQRTTLPLLGADVQLGESEDEEKQRGDHHDRRNRHEDD